MANNVPYPTVFGFWTNKGGVGKTTLSFHMATTYAELFPNKTVVAIDMCPQTNLSATLLTGNGATIRKPGDEEVLKVQNIEKAQDEIPKTIGGYLMGRLTGTTVAAEKFVLDISHSHNHNVPRNLHLVCGDSNLDLLAPQLSARAREVPNKALKSIPFRTVHNYLREFIQKLAEFYANSEDSENLVVFIDTNPALSIYTEIALCAMTELVMPVCADTFSSQAIKSMYHLVYGVYPTTSAAALAYEDESFAHLLKVNNMSLPGITAIIHNRNPIINNNGQQRALTVKANKAMAAEQCRKFYAGYEKALTIGELSRVFALKKSAAGEPLVCNTVQEFADVYTSTMRDMRSCGVAALHSGFPLWKLLEKERWVDKQFKSIDFKESVPGLMKDLLFAMKDMLGEARWNMKDEEAMQRLAMIAQLD